MWSKRLARFWLARRRGIASHDAGAFPRPARRTLVLRIVLAGAAVALLLSAAASARDLESRERGLLPSDTTGMVVIDLSLSIDDEDYHEVRRVLNGLIESDARIGLVVFSDVAYELLPPGTPASHLRPMLRLLVPPRLGNPVNPWTGTFRAGTRISSALDLARSILERDEVEDASILLVSDLETAPDDVPALVQTVDTIRRSDIAFRVVGLAPSSDARAIFEGLLQRGEFEVASDQAFDEQRRLLGRRRRASYPLRSSFSARSSSSRSRLTSGSRDGSRCPRPRAPGGRRDPGEAEAFQPWSRRRSPAWRSPPDSPSSPPTSLGGKTRCPPVTSATACEPEDAGPVDAVDDRSGRLEPSAARGWRRRRAPARSSRHPRRSARRGDGLGSARRPSSQRGAGATRGGRLGRRRARPDVRALRVSSASSVSRGWRPRRRIRPRRWRRRC